MALGRLPSNVKIVDDNGLPTPEFLRAWNGIVAKTGGVAQGGPSAPTGLTYTFEPGVIRLSCDDNPVSENVTGYQWRIGAVWDTAVVLVPLGASSIKFPISLGNIGTATVWVTANDSGGNMSTPSSMSVTITAGDLGINGPVVNLDAPRAAFVNQKNGGGLTPASITLTATIFNLPTPVYAWQVDGVLQVGQVSSTFALPAFSGTAKVVRCDVTSGSVSAFDLYTIFCVNEGDDSIQAGLTNENQSISVNAAGTAVAGLPASSTMIVVRGSTILSSGVVYSLVSNVGCTASINSSTGVASVTAISADTATATFRATVTATGTVIDKVMTLNKSYPGATGTTGSTGPRGSLKGYGSQYSISSSSWSDLKANRVIENMLTGASLTTDLATTTNLQIGDTVQLTNGSSFVQSKFWSGSAWITAGTVIEGNLLVNGSGTFTGDITGASNLNITGQGRFSGAYSGGLGQASVYANESLSAAVGVIGVTSDNTGSGVGVIGSAGINTNGTGVLGQVTGASSTGIGVSGVAHSSGSIGVQASNNGAGWALKVLGAISVDSQIQSSVATGTAPLSVASTTVVPNLNAERWAGITTSGTTAGNPGTPTHALNCSVGGVAFRFPILIP